MKKLSILLGTAAIAAAAVSFAVAGAHHSAVVGMPAPTFDATDSNGNNVKLSDYKGKYVVLEWSNFNCPYVVKHYGSGNMQSLQKKYTAKGVVWLTVFSSAEGNTGYFTPDQLNKMAKEKGMASTIIPDSKGTLGHLYGATNTPDMFVINPDGNLIYSGAIDNNRTPDPEAIKSSTNYVSAALDEAMAGDPVAVKTSRPYGCGIKYSGE